MFHETLNNQSQIILKQLLYTSDGKTI